MDIGGKNALVLGGYGLVGTAVCRELLAQRPARLVVASRKKANALRKVEQLRAEADEGPTRILPAWGDVFLRAEWQGDALPERHELLAEPDKRRRLIADVLDPLDDEMIRASMLARIILGSAPGLNGTAADIVVDCVNTATAVSYQDVYASARRLADLAETDSAAANLPAEVGSLLASLYLPQLVRHVQLLHEAMRRAGTQAYVKVGTSGTGGMGFSIPYTHGEERPSRLLLAKAALSGAQTLLTFLMARTPGGPSIVKEVKPAALIAWRAIEHGPIGRGGRALPLYDCPLDRAVSTRQPDSLVAQGDFGTPVGQDMHQVYIHTGENGQFSADEFAAITALGQMEAVTPEEIAGNVVREIAGSNSGHDVVAALDASVMGPSYRAGYLRDGALERLRQLEAQHGEAVAFGILGPPRLSKLLFEGHLLKRVCADLDAVNQTEPKQLSAALEQEVEKDAALRRRIISIGLPILLGDGERLLRGPSLKVAEAEQGWVDLTPANVARWRERLTAIREAERAELEADSSSRNDRLFGAAGQSAAGGDGFAVGEIAAWILATEDGGWRDKR